KQMLIEVAKEGFDQMMAEGANHQEAIALVTKLTSARMVHAVLDLARADQRIATTMQQFDRNIWLLNTPSGVVNLRDGSIRKARRHDYFTKITRVGPSNEPTPIFDQFVLDIMGWNASPEVCTCSVCERSKGSPEHQRRALHQAEVRARAEYLKRVYGYALSG